MAEYHVGCGLFGIYAGTFKKPTKYAREHGLQEWQNKSDVTNECLEAVASYLRRNDKELHFTFNDGKRYVLKVEEVEENG